MQRRRWVAAVGVWAGIAGWLGCNAIVGIQNGILGSLDGGGGDGADVTNPDGPAGGDATGDGTGGGDGGLDAPADAPQDADAGPALASCNLVPNSTVLVDDLSKDDGGDLQFAHSLGIVTVNNAGGVAIVVAQTQSENQDFRGYRVDFGQQGNPPSYLSGVAAKGGVQIVQTISDPKGNGNAVVAQYETAFFNQASYGLMLVPLPNDNNQPFSQGGYELVNFGLAYASQAYALPISPTGAFWLASTQGESVQRQDIFLGLGFSNDAGAAMQDLERVSSGANWMLGIPPFSIGNQVYVIADHATDAGAGVWSVPTDLSSQNMLGSIAYAPGMSGIFGGHASADNPGKAMVIAGSIDNQAMIDEGVATVDPSMLGSLTIGQPPFVHGATIALADVPFDNGANTWADDEFFAVGSPGDKSGGIVMVWLGPDGHVVSSTATSPGKLVPTPNGVPMTALAAQGHIAEAQATLVMAWVERATNGMGQTYDRLYSAQIVCNPYMPGGG